MGHGAQGCFVFFVLYAGAAFLLEVFKDPGNIVLYFFFYGRNLKHAGKTHGGEFTVDSFVMRLVFSSEMGETDIPGKNSLFCGVRDFGVADV